MESESDPSPTPKLSLFSLPAKPPEPPGLITPPLQTLASVPFLWEEAPGKPRASPDINTPTSAKPKVARCLELPPRLSPTTVLDGPDDVGRSLSSTWSFRRGKKEGGRLKVSNFGSWRWGQVHHHKESNKAIVEGSFDFSPTPESVEEVVDDALHGDETKVNITSSLKRRRSFLRVPHPKSHLWASIYESFKQAVVPWRRKPDQNRPSSPSNILQ